MTDLHDLLEREAARIDEELTHYDAAAEDAFVRKFAERVATEQADQRRASPARAVGHRSSGPQGAAGPAPVTAAPTARTTPGRTETPLSSAACRAELRLQLHHLCRSITAAGSGKALQGERALEIGCAFYTRGSEAMAEWWWRSAADGGDESAPHLLAVLLTTICREEEAGQWRKHAEAVGLTVPDADPGESEAGPEAEDQWPVPLLPLPERLSDLEPGILKARVLSGRSIRRRAVPRSAKGIGPC
ncbi:hypothetical protein [Kitasatospora sp. NPDC004272]